MSVLRWHELTAPELRELAEADATVLWPVGSTEQHGQHLVSGFDLASATAVCERAVSVLARKALVAPGLSFGASGHWLPLGATLSLNPATLAAVVADVVASLEQAGFRRLVIVNGHAGNVGPVLAALGGVSSSAVRVELVSYWSLVDPGELASRCVADDGGIGHAGEVETSIALYLGGGLLRGELPAVEGARLGGDRPGSRRAVLLRVPRPSEESEGGVYGDPRPARAELGEFVVEQAAAALAEHCRAFSRPDQPDGGS